LAALGVQLATGVGDEVLVEQVVVV